MTPSGLSTWLLCHPLTTVGVLSSLVARAVLLATRRLAESCLPAFVFGSSPASVPRLRPIRPMDAACRATALPPTTSASPLSAAQLALPTTALKDCESRIVGQPFVSFL